MAKCVILSRFSICRSCQIYYLITPFSIFKLSCYCVIIILFVRQHFLKLIHQWHRRKKNNESLTNPIFVCIPLFWKQQVICHTSTKDILLCHTMVLCTVYYYVIRWSCVRSIIKMIVAAFFSKTIKWGKRQHSLNK